MAERRRFPRTALFFWWGLAACLAWWLRPPQGAPATLPFVAVTVLATAVGLGSASAAVLSRVRAGGIGVGEGPVWRLWRRSLPAGGLGVIVGWLVTAGFSSFGSGAHPALLFVVGGMAVCAAYGLGMRRTGPVSVRMTSLMPWLITDTALPAALLCGTLGVALGFVAVPQDTMVSAPALARMLAGGCFTYTLVGFGSFLKVWTEGSRGLVTAPLPPTSWPGPIAVGLFLGIALLLAGRLLVVFSGVEAALVPAIKGAWGLGLGGFLSFLGARQGAVAVGRLAPPAPALG